MSDIMTNSKDQPLVSVWMITYNHEPFVAQAIQGVLMQQCNFSFELVIGEDCSTDKTWSICHDYAKANPNINLLTNTSNLGSSANAYRTFQSCRGKYIALCEGDDYWIDPLKLQKQVKLLEDNSECSMCVAKTKMIEDEQQIKILGCGDKRKYEFLDILHGPYFHTSTYLIRKEYLDIFHKADPALKKGDTSYRYFLSDLGPFILLDEVVSVYRITKKGVWTSLSDRDKLISHINLHNAYYRKFKRKYRSNFSSILIRECFELFKYSIYNFSLRYLTISLFGILIGMCRNPKYFISFFSPKLGLLRKKLTIS